MVRLHTPPRGGGDGVSGGPGGQGKGVWGCSVGGQKQKNEDEEEKEEQKEEKRANTICSTSAKFDFGQFDIGQLAEIKLAEIEHLHWCRPFFFFFGEEGTLDCSLRTSPSNNSVKRNLKPSWRLLRELPDPTIVDVDHG